MSASAPGERTQNRRLLKVLNSPVQLAQRYALFQPIYGNSWRRKTVPWLLKDVRCIWKNQLERLYKLDALPGLRDNPLRQLIYMKNCPACTVLETPRLLFCTICRVGSSRSRGELWPSRHEAG
ncbi:MAG TPA: hypothetical protein VGM05_11580 [Planctomycetaceae bacterium]|jgi:hypothetical protein